MAQQSAADAPEPDHNQDHGDASLGEAAIVAWVGEHQDRLWRYLRLLGSSRDVAKDIAQDVFLVAIQKQIPRLPKASCRAWLQEAARRIFLAHLRKSVRRPRLLDPGCLELAWVDGLGSNGHGAHGAHGIHGVHGIHDRAIEALQQCLEKLVPRELEALRMRYSRGLSRQKMAKALGISQYGVKMLLRRVRGRLRRCVEWRVDRGGGGGGGTGGGTGEGTGEGTGGLG
jgi:DNA-directed RNA polymerase specialized sigma24 family protein